MNYGVGRQVVNDLLQPPSVPFSYQVADFFQLQNSIGEKCLDLFQGLFADFTKIGAGPRQWKGDPHSATYDDRQIVHQSINAAGALKNPVDAAGLGLLKLTSFQGLARKLNDTKRVADFMGKNAKKNIAV